MPQAIRSYFGDGESLGVNIEYSVEELPLGTAGSVRLASEQARRDVPRHLRRRALRRRPGALVDFHKETRRRRHDRAQVGREPARVRDRRHRRGRQVERFLEKPSWGQVFSDTINTGIYVLEPEVLKHVPTDRPYDFSKELFPLLLEMGRPIYGHVLRRLLAGHRQPRPVPAGELRRARRDACALNVDGVRLPRRTSGSARAPTSTTSRRSRAGVHRQPLPDRARRLDRPVHRPVERRHAARARAHRPLGHRRVDPRRPQRLIEGAVVGRSCDIRDHVRIQEGAAIGDEVTIGSEASIMPHVRIYPYKEVETGSQIYENLIWETRASSRLFGKDGVYRSRQRRPDARDRGAPGDRARDGAQARRTRRREPRLGAGLPHDQAGDDLGPERRQASTSPTSRARRPRSAGTS